jgi:hypothetical protein
VRTKRKDEKVRAEEDRRLQREQANQQSARMDKRYFLQVSKQCSAPFKAQTRDYREKVCAKID